MEKARCCLRGDKRRAFIDYDPENIHASVASHTSIRMLLSIIAASIGHSNQIQLKGSDINNAYLYGILDVPIIMAHPTNSTQKQTMPGYVCRLERSLYGAQQAGEIWGSVLREKLKSFGFLPLKLDEKLYILSKENKFIIIVIVVDHLAFASNSSTLISDFKNCLSAEFDVKLYG